MILDILQQPNKFQWDFRRFYFAGKLSLYGESPYDFSKMMSLFGNKLILQQPFLYPPHTVIFFRSLARIDLFHAYYVFFALKLVAYVILFFLWKKYLFPDSSLPFYLVFIVASMGSEAIRADLTAGNISVFLQVLFWAGVACLLRSKITISGLFIVSAASVKFFVLSPLLLVYILIGYWRYFILFVGILAGIVVCIYIQSPLYFSSVVLNNIQTIAVTETGHIAISIRNILQDMYAISNSPPLRNYQLIYAAIVACILICTIYVVIRNKETLLQNKLLSMNLCIVCVCLITPLLKDYEQTILIPPTFYLIDSFIKKRSYIISSILFFIYIIFTHNVLSIMELAGYTFNYEGLSYSQQTVVYLLQNYHVLLALFITWFYYLYLINDTGKATFQQSHPISV